MHTESLTSHSIQRLSGESFVTSFHCEGDRVRSGDQVLIKGSSPLPPDGISFTMEDGTRSGLVGTNLNWTLTQQSSDEWKIVRQADGESDSVGTSNDTETFTADGVTGGDVISTFGQVVKLGGSLLEELKDGLEARMSR